MNSQTFAGRVIDWAADNPFKAAVIYCIAMLIAVLMLIAHLSRLHIEWDRPSKVRQACHLQGGIYIDGACRKPSDIIRPE